MTDSLEEIEQQQSIINNDADKHRRLRDELNKQTKEWVMKRDELNAQVRELVDQAGKHREDRDALNQNVREAKALRDEWNKKFGEINDKVSELRKDSPRESGPSLGRLKKDLENLEYQQQTSVLSKDKEAQLIEKMRDILRQIDEREKSQEQNTELSEALAELRETRDQAEEHHRMVSEYAEKAQVEHDAMISLYEQADKLRKEADQAQEKFIESKLLADEEHRKHIEEIKKLHEYDKSASVHRHKQRKARRKKEETASRKEAEDIFDRFKSGDKLSTEDLMALQKSGLL